MNRIITKITSIIKFLFYNIKFRKKILFNGLPYFDKNSLLELEGNAAKGTIGEKFACRRNVKLRVVNGELKIGQNVFINDNCSITCRGVIQIGNDCLIGQNVLIYDHDHLFRGSGKISEQGFNIGTVTIGQNVWIGSNTVILKNVRIGDNCVIGAGSIIYQDIPESSLVYNAKETVIKPIKS